MQLKINNLPKKDVMKMNPFKQHSKACFAESVIAVAQDWRDDRDINAPTFRHRVRSESIFEEAASYLRDGLMTCICAVGAFDVVLARFQNSLDPDAPHQRHAYLEADSVAQSLLACRNLTPEGYATIVGMLARKQEPFVYHPDTD